MDANEFTSNYRTHKTYIYYVVGRFISDIATKEDLVQHTFLKAWVSRHTFRGDSSFRTWLTSIAINTCLNFFIAQKIRPEHFVDRHILPEDIQSFEDTLSQAISDEEVAKVYKSIELLPPDLQSVMVLRVIYEFDYEDIATTLKIPIGTVRSRLYRAKYHLRDMLR